MASINSDIFPKFKSNIKLSTRQDGDGNEIEVEVREDEEQSVKLQEIVDILVAAGYFRARIKGLSSFDKVVGGMTWCIESCNIDVDVDLLFQENLTIGQKISLTEKIVSLLPKMKCPHRIEPHQIQGLDFIHIYPVIQWLVKTSMEYRDEMSEFVKSYAVNQFNKQFKVSSKSDKIAFVYENIKTVKDFYRPQRYYRRKNAAPEDSDARIQITLLEYGYRGTFVPKENSQVPQEDLEDQKKEELHIAQLMKNLANAATEDSIDTEKLTAEEREQLIKHYASLEAELKDCEKSATENKLHLQKRQEEVLEQQGKKIETEEEKLTTEITELTNSISEIESKQIVVNQNLQEIALEEVQDPEIVKQVEELVLIHEHLKQQEQQFREHCTFELTRLQGLIENAQKIKLPEVNKSKTNDELEQETEKLKVQRLKIAKKTRAIAALQRQLDEVPSRAELAQYQRRFLELYNQVSAKHKETKQYYTLYNTLDDTRLYNRKELNLLNSILDSYPEAMQSVSGKDEFLRQFEAIVESVKLTKAKVEQKCQEERRHRDVLSQKLLGLIDQQRRYVAAVRQLGIECRKNEILFTQHSS